MKVIFTSLLVATLLSLAPPAYAQTATSAVETQIESRTSVEIDGTTSNVEVREQVQTEAQTSERATPELFERLQDRAREVQERRTELQNIIDARKREAQLRLQEQRGGTADTTLDRRLENDTDAALQREDRQEVRTMVTLGIESRVEAFLTRLVLRFEAAIDRLDMLADRLESRIEKLAERMDTTEAKRHIDSAREHLQEARESNTALEAHIQVVIASDNPREELEEVRRLAREVKTELMAAHESLQNAVVSLKVEVQREGEDEESPQEE